MSAQHTPGPWKGNITRYNRDFRTCVNVMTEDGLRFIAAVSCDPHTDQLQLAANAKLIAAAPDMLAALQEIDAMWSGEGGHVHPIHARSGKVREVWKHARAAIARATS
jgi:hypothetical protein